MPKSFSRRRILSKAGAFILSELENAGKPIVSEFELSLLVAKTRAVSKLQKLRLRQGQSWLQDCRTLKKNLLACSKVGADPDYTDGSLLRVLTVPDLPAEDIVCLSDPTAYVSHLSAMMRWGLTDRVSKALLISQPSHDQANNELKKIVESASREGEKSPIKLLLVKHPGVVRKRKIWVKVTNKMGISRVSRGTFTRLASIGQTFADMVQDPDLCGGILHVMEIWSDHAQIYLDEIVSAIDAYCDHSAKSRAGYIIEERMSLKHAKVDIWRSRVTFGALQKLDPTKEFATRRSEKWNLSLNE